MTDANCWPADPARTTENFVEPNVSSTPTGHVARLNPGETFSVTPIGFVRRPLFELTAKELDAKAAAYRAMAASASTMDVGLALSRLADRFAVLAAERRTSDQSA